MSPNPAPFVDRKSLCIAQSTKGAGKIIGMDGKWKIDESGNLVAQKVTTQELEVGSQTKPSGITIYDKQGKVGCIQVENVETGAVIVSQGACGSVPPTVSTPKISSPAGELELSTTTETATASSSMATTTPP